MKKFFLFLLTVISSAFCYANTEIKFPQPYSKDAIKLFADHLFDLEFYLESEIEYNRFLFFTESQNNSASLQDPQEIDAAFNLLQIYNIQNNYEGIIFLDKKFNNEGEISNQHKILKEGINLLNGKFLFLEHTDFLALENLGNRYSKTSPDNIFILSSQIIQKDLSNAKITAQNLSEQNENFKEISRLLNSYNYKKPLLAAGLSAIIPGAGKFYTGAWQKGISSLLTVGAFAGASAYCGYNYGIKNWRPWTYGSIAAILYGVNIYSSYQDALRINQNEYRKINESLNNTYDLLWEDLLEKYKNEF